MSALNRMAKEFECHSRQKIDQEFVTNPRLWGMNKILVRKPTVLLVIDSTNDKEKKRKPGSSYHENITNRFLFLLYINC